MGTRVGINAGLRRRGARPDRLAVRRDWWRALRLPDATAASRRTLAYQPLHFAATLPVIATVVVGTARCVLRRRLLRVHVGETDFSRGAYRSGRCRVGCRP